MSVSDRDGWGQLGLFESTDTVRRLYERRHHGKKPSAAIVAYAMQGRQYFAAARQSLDIIRPLLVYYGAMSLARAFTLFDSGQEPHGSHGLHLNLADTKSLARLPKAKIKIDENGTFPTLMRTSHNKERIQLLYIPRQEFALRMEFTPQLSSPRDCYTTGAVDVAGKTSITLTDVLSRLPDLLDIFRASFDEPPETFEVQAMIWLDGTIVTFPEGPNVPSTIGDLRQRFAIPEEISVYQGGTAAPAGYRISIPPDWGVALPCMRSDRYDRVFFVPPVPEVGFLSTLSLLYLTTYAMGMLARYYPAMWLALLTGQPGDRYFPVLRHALDLAEQQIPARVLELWKESARVV